MRSKTRKLAITSELDTTVVMSKATRRTFLGGLSSAAAMSLVPGGLQARRSPNEVPNIAAVGVGGKGWVDANGAAKHGNIVAFCDVEQSGSRKRGGFASAAEKWPKARRYTDWRVMLEKERTLDGLTVSTPDHMHAPVTMTALQQGIGCYTQKPLTRTVYESRKVTAAAAKAGVATQMGNQHHNGTSYRSLVNLVQKGLLGKIKHAHAWSNRPIWPQGITRPRPSQPLPKPSTGTCGSGSLPHGPLLRESINPSSGEAGMTSAPGPLATWGAISSIPFTGLSS